MSFNILDAVKDYFNPDLVSTAASFLGESGDSVTKAVGGLVPTVLSGIVNKADSGGSDLIFDLARQAAGSGILSNLVDNFKPGGGGIPDYAPSMIQGVFGDKSGSIANNLAQFAGIKGSSAASLLGSILPLALGVLGRHSAGSGLNAGSLLSLLGGQRSSILNSIPSGLNLSGILGDSIKKVTEPAQHAASHTYREVEEKASTGGKWLWPLLLGLLGVGLLLYLMKGCGGEHKEETVVETPVVTPETAKVVVVVPVPVRESLMVKLPNGKELNAYKGGIEDRLVAFLNDPNAVPGNDNWFDFNDLNFTFGTAEIIPESKKEVDNIVEILKAYPNVKIKIGGYTDKVGDEAANKKLSGERANAVKAALEAAGVGGQIDGAEGYGSEFAKFPADAPEEDRIKDRRVSVSVRKK